MFRLLIFFLVYGMFNLLVYLKISGAFTLSNRGKRIFKIILLLGGLIYPVVELISSHASMGLYFPRYLGFLWINGILFTFGMIFLAQGLFKMFGFKLKGWILLSLSLVVPILVQFIHSTSPKASKVRFNNFAGSVILAGVFSLAIFLVYRIITGTKDISERRKGILLTGLVLGALVKALGFNFGMGLLVLGMGGMVYARISEGLNLNRKGNLILLSILGLVMLISLPRLVGWGYGRPAFLDLYYLIGLLNGFLYLAFAFFLVETGIGVIHPGRSRPRVIIILILLSLTFVYSAYNGGRYPTVTRITIPLRQLSHHVSGFTIAQLTDLHLGDIISPAYLENVVERTNALLPDLIVLTGDIFDTLYSDTYITQLKRLKAKYGILAVTGNHEYKGGCVKYQHFVRTAREMGIRILDNEWVTIKDSLQVAGVNDPVGHPCGSPYLQPNLVLKGINRNKPVILLSHRPINFLQSVEAGVDLQISGHTHGGLFFPVTLIIRTVYPYSYGLYEAEGAFIYTSSGTGLYYMPLRLLTSNEIVLFQLVPGKSSSPLQKRE